MRQESSLVKYFPHVFWIHVNSCFKYSRARFLSRFISVLLSFTSVCQICLRSIIIIIIKIDSNPWLMYLFDAPFCWIVFWTLVVSYVFIFLKLFFKMGICYRFNVRNHEVLLDYVRIQNGDWE